MKSSVRWCCLLWFFTKISGAWLGAQSDPGFEKGIAALHRHDCAAAVTSFTASIEIVPTIAAYANRATAYTALGEYDKAIADYDHAIGINDHSVFSVLPAIRYCRGFLFYQRKDYAKAIDDFGFCISRFADRAPSFVARARCFIGQGKMTEARNDLEQAVKLGSTDLEAILTLAGLCSRQGDAKSSRARFGMAVALAEKSGRPARSYNSIAWFLATIPDESVRDGKQAVTYATKACELTKWNDPNSIDTLAAACAAAGNFDDAMKWEEKYLARNDLRAEEKQAA